MLRSSASSLGPPQLQNVKGKKYHSNLEWIPDRPWCLQSCQREPSPGKPKMKKVHYSTWRDAQIIRHSGIYDFPRFRWSAAHKVPLPLPPILSFLLNEAAMVIKRLSPLLASRKHSRRHCLHTGSLGLQSGPSWLLVWRGEARKSDTLHLDHATGVLIWFSCLCQSLLPLTAFAVKVFTEKHFFLSTGPPSHREAWALRCSRTLPVGE